MAMIAQSQQMSRYRKTARLRTVAVVSGHPDGHEVEVVLGAVDHDVVLVEATAHAYSRIKHIRPDLVILYLAGDDTEGCQLLSMLALDRETSRIPVVARMVPGESSPADWPIRVSEDVRPVSASELN
jgi:PleD family two-component response regulator